MRTLERSAGGWRFAETKRARSRRIIKFQDWVLETLKNLEPRTIRRSGCSQPDNSELVFTSPAGRPIYSDKLAKKFKAILREAGLPMIRLYDLRHTSATLALSAGAPPKVVAEQLGHASAAFTLDVYAHLLPHMQTEAASKVEALLNPIKQGRSKSIRGGRRKPAESMCSGNTRQEGNVLGAG